MPTPPPSPTSVGTDKPKPQLRAKKTTTQQASPQSANQAPQPTTQPQRAWVAKHSDKVRLSIPPFNVVETGIFVLDLALGGGLAEGFAHQFSGWQKGGKSSTAYRFMGNFMRKHPDKTVLLFDSEGRFSPVWAEMLGVPVHEGRLFVVQTTFVEEMHEIVQEATLSDDTIGLIVLDSLGATRSAQELAAGVTEYSVGIGAKRQTQFAAKLTSIQNARRQVNNPLTYLYTNQLRNKMGLVFGNPEKGTGADFWNYMVQTEVRMRGGEQATLGAKEAKAEGTAAGLTHIEHKFQVIKNTQIPILKEGAYSVSLRNEGGCDFGEVDDLKTIVTVAKTYGLYTGGGTAQKIEGAPHTFNNMAQAMEWLTENPLERDRLAARCIAEARRRFTNKAGVGHAPLPPDNYLYRRWADASFNI